MNSRDDGAEMAIVLCRASVPAAPPTQQSCLAGCECHRHGFVALSKDYEDTRQESVP